MKRLIIVFICVVVLGVSCASNPVPEENIDFQTETGMSLIFAKRGIYSLTKSYNDADYKEFFNKFLKNKLVFSVDEGQNEWAVFSTEDDIIYITVNDLYKKYNQGSNNALLTSTIYAIGLIGLNVSPAIIETRFYEIISDYAYYGVDVTTIVNDDLFVNGKFKIAHNGIVY